ncbi:TRS130 [Candida theae]|uniref:TRS130 n=1 Tax=Candida theae TaxID=1198502 RepID=A0AAD5BFH9_9ASCO|nr:TRS130 [Candida theae]KAI5958594.1 TRS130 [Candida theae]
MSAVPDPAHNQLDLVRIGYYDPFGVYPHIQNDISKRLPLTNLHIRLKPNQSVKTITKLDVDFVEEVPKKSDYITHDIKTYVRLIFVRVDSLDKYRGQVRPLIREWLKNLVLKTNCSWMIVLYIPQDAKDRSSSIMKTSFFDKLQHDFGPEGKELKTILPMGEDSIKNDGERVFKLKQSSDEEDIITSFMMQLKALLSNSFVGRYHTFNELIHQRKNVEQFAAKLELYNLLKDMKLLQDALLVNEELADDLDNLAAHNADSFNHELQLSSSLTDFNFDDFVNEEQLKQQLVNSEKINLVQLKSLIFINESFILQELARGAVSNSIASKHVSKLYQRLMLFLNDSHFNDNNEFVYLLIESFLDIPIVQQLIDSVSKSGDDDGDVTVASTNEVPLIDILEMRAQLKLFKRTVVGKIAKLQNIVIDGLRGDAFEEVALDEEDQKQAKVIIQSPELSEIVKDEKSFVDYYFGLTEDIIADLVKCTRVKSIDILSLDLAILNYNQGNYQECLDTLQNSYDYFLINSWDFLGGILLEIYLGCVEQLRGQNNAAIGDEEVLKTCLNLLACLVKKHGDSVGINSYKLVHNKRHVAQLFDKIDGCSGSLSESLEFPLNNFFKFKVKPYVNEDDSTDNDVYYVEVDIYNSFNVPVRCSSMQVLLVDDAGAELKFKSNNIELSDVCDKQTFKLYTCDVKFGLFSVNRLVLSLNEKLSLCQNYSKEESGGPDSSIFNDTVVEHKSKPKSFSSSDILICQSVDKFQAQFLASKVVELGSTEVTLVLKNGSNKVSDVKIELFSRTDGVRLSKPQITIEKLDAREIQTLQVPYTFFDTKLINMQAHITYFVGEVKYTAQVSYDVDARLSVSVSVQDVFKTNFFYSKFQVGTVDAKLPIRLLSQKLTSADYDIKSPNRSDLQDLVAFGEQPITFFYKINPKEGHSIDCEDKLDLSLCYTNLQEECEHLLDKYVWQLLQKHELIRYWYLIKETILSKVHFDLNRYAVQDVLKVVNLEHLQLFADRIIGRYVEHSQDQVQLHQIFARLEEITTEKSDLSQVEHQLRIKVAVPILNYLHVVEYKYEKRTYVVGEPIPVTLHIQTVTNWSDHSNNPPVLAVSSPSRGTNDLANANAAAATATAASPAEHDASARNDEVLPPTPPPINQKFLAIVQPDENWLVSGVKKQTIDLKNPFQTEVRMIPLHVGKLYLPKLTISPIDETGAMMTPAANSDIEFVNGCETIMSVPDVRHIQFSF